MKQLILNAYYYLFVNALYMHFGLTEYVQQFSLYLAMLLYDNLYSIFICLVK